MSDQEEGEDIEREESDQGGEFQDILPPEPQQIENLHQKIKSGLKVIGKTVDGEGWAFTELECHGQNISKLHEVLLSYPYLRKINFVRNKIEDYSSITQIKYLTHLNLQENFIKSFDQFGNKGQLEFLIELNLSDNSLKSLDHFELKNLQRLILDSNDIESAQNFKGHPNLKLLSLNKNKMTSMEDLKNMPSLTELSLVDNPVQKLSGLQGNCQLKYINLKNTQIEQFTPDEELPDLPYINNINLEECKKFNNIKSFDTLKKYENSLNIINVNGTLLAEEVGDSVKKEIIMKLPKIKSINEEPVEQEEVEAALQEKKEREEEEARKLAEEEEARKQAEEEEAARKLAEEEEAKNKENEDAE